MRHWLAPAESWLWPRKSYPDKQGPCFFNKLEQQPTLPSGACGGITGLQIASPGHNSGGYGGVRENHWGLSKCRWMREGGHTSSTPTATLPGQSPLPTALPEQPRMTSVRSTPQPLPQLYIWNSISIPQPCVGGEHMVLHPLYSWV